MPQLTATRTVTVADFGPHTMLIDHAGRTVDIASDWRTNQRAVDAGWRKVCAELRELGCIDLEDLGDMRADDHWITCFAGTF